MTKLPLFIVLSSSLLQLACGEAANPGSGLGSAGSSMGGSGGGAAGSSAGGANAGSGGTGNPGGSGGTGSGGTAGAPPLPPVAAQPHHFGAPFSIVNGRISADSNEYGLEASFYTIHNAKDTPANVTTTTGQICVNGGLRRAVIGDFASYSGVDLGFSVGPTSFRTLTETLVSIAPEAPPWVLPPELLGLAVTVTGLAPFYMNFLASPGGQDPGGQHGVVQDLTMFTTCNRGPISRDQPSKEFFGDLQNVWCTEFTQRWTATSVSAFLWTIDTQIVDQIVEGGVNDVTDPYDLCLSDIRPILAGAGPDEPLPDAGAAPEADAGSEPDAGPPDAGP